jgi:membrane-bound ClpP family serine protease
MRQNMSSEQDPSSTKTRSFRASGRSEMLKKITRGTAALLSVLITTILLLIALSNPGFFMFNPFETGFSILGFAQLIAIASWLLLMCGPVFILLSKFQLVGAWWALFLVSVLAWPVSVFMIHVILFMQTSDSHLDYLMEDPVFIISDIVVPITYLVISLHLRSRATQDRQSRLEGSLPA